MVGFSISSGEPLDCTATELVGYYNFHSRHCTAVTVIHFMMLLL
jgi:hypothetical protein